MYYRLQFHRILKQNINCKFLFWVLWISSHYGKDFDSTLLNSSHFSIFLICSPKYTVETFTAKHEIYPNDILKTSLLQNCNYRFAEKEVLVQHWCSVCSCVFQQFREILLYWEITVILWQKICWLLWQYICSHPYFNLSKLIKVLSIVITSLYIMFFLQNVSRIFKFQSNTCYEYERLKCDIYIFLLNVYINMFFIPSLSGQFIYAYLVRKNRVLFQWFIGGDQKCMLR